MGHRAHAAATAAFLQLGALVGPLSGVLPGSVAAATPEANVSMKAYFPADFQDDDYQKTAVQKVLGNWKVSPPYPAAGKKTVVISTIGRDGKLLETRFNLKSGDPRFDQTALAAVRKAAPFPPLPKRYRGPSIEVHWHFEVVRPRGASPSRERRVVIRGVCEKRGKPIILVTGVSGTVGKELVKRLAASGAKFRAGFHSADKAARARAAGADAVAMDLARPETLRPALEAIHTFLRPNSFMQNVLTFAPTIRTQGAFTLPARDARISHIDVRDIAAVAEATLTGEGHEGKAYALSGPEALSYREIAEKLSAAIGRKVSYADIPDAEFRKGAIQAGLAEPFVEALMNLIHFYIGGNASRVTGEVRRITGREAISFDQFARDHAPAFG